MLPIYGIIISKVIDMEKNLTIHLEFLIQAECKPVELIYKDGANGIIPEIGDKIIFRVDPLDKTKRELIEGKVTDKVIDLESYYYQKIIYDVVVTRGMGK